MKNYISIILLSLAVMACNNTIQAPDLKHPFAGCWQSEDGLSREVWTQDSSAWLFGYSANHQEDGRVTFFEHMRIEPHEGGQVLVVTGSKGDVVEFTREDTGAANEYQFVNAAHDYPQVITYSPSPGRLDAHISLMNGEKRSEFLKRACDPDD